MEAAARVRHHMLGMFVVDAERIRRYVVGCENQALQQAWSAAGRPCFTSVDKIPEKVFRILGFRVQNSLKFLFDFFGDMKRMIVDAVVLGWPDGPERILLTPAAGFAVPDILAALRILFPPLEVCVALFIFTVFVCLCIGFYLDFVFCLQSNDFLSKVGRFEYKWLQDQTCLFV